MAVGVVGLFDDIPANYKHLLKEAIGNNKVNRLPINAEYWNGGKYGIGKFYANGTKTGGEFDEHVKTKMSDIFLAKYPDMWTHLNEEKRCNIAAQLFNKRSIYRDYTCVKQYSDAEKYFYLLQSSPVKKWYEWW